MLSSPDFVSGVADAGLRDMTSKTKRGSSTKYAFNGEFLNGCTPGAFERDSGDFSLLSWFRIPFLETQITGLPPLWVPPESLSRPRFNLSSDEDIHFVVPMASTLASEARGPLFVPSVASSPVRGFFQADEPSIRVSPLLQPLAPDNVQSLNKLCVFY
ncbi:hypothetical protein TNCT_166641 [Trichonephila clavata]|uniref:Uncharacterized protein n=1 Tax=Trichonephila clavata TaxID=2740835 RepID=A0A8X6L5I8_TRICU|nr:hypothetical protein TNCT_166641 [Trichonephila clavata]